MPQKKHTFDLCPHFRDFVFHIADGLRVSGDADLLRKRCRLIFSSQPCRVAALINYARNPDFHGIATSTIPEPICFIDIPMHTGMPSSYQ